MPVYDFGSHEGALFIAMPYIQGAPLSKLISAHAPLPAPRAVDLMHQTLSGLAAAHATGLIHRDIKPDNIMITSGSMGEELVKLLDFGMAKLHKQAGEVETVSTRDGLFVGTAAYAPPEQAWDKVTHQSDLYSVGVILFELLTGKRPFSAPTPIALLFAHRDNAVPLERLDEVGVPPALRMVVDRALKKDPAERWPSAEAMASALRESVGINSSGSFATLTTPPKPLDATVKLPSSLIHGMIAAQPVQKKTTWRLPLAVAVLIGLGVGIPLWPSDSPEQMAQTAPMVITKRASPRAAAAVPSAVTTQAPVSAAPRLEPPKAATTEPERSPLDHQLDLIHTRFSEGDLTGTRTALKRGLAQHKSALTKRIQSEKRFAGLRSSRLWRARAPATRPKPRPKPTKAKRKAAVSHSPKTQPKQTDKVW